MSKLNTSQMLKTTTATVTKAPTGILQRKCACGNHTIAGRECAECSKKRQLGLQTKLKVNEPGDVYEQEADRITDQVLAAPIHSAVSTAPPRIQRFTGQGTGQVDTAPASVDRVLASSGSPLEPSLQQDMGQRFSYDFSRVRVHSGAAAEQSARDMNAHAYTVGTEIVFGAHKFAPENREGRSLLAHELTHVVQQRNAPIDISAVEPQGSAAEREADAAASDVTAGRAAKPPSAAPRGIPRDVGWASRGEIPDAYGIGYNTIYKNAGPGSKAAVLALTSLETPSMFVNIEAYKKLEKEVRKSILALEPHAAGTACAGWFDVMRANDPDFKPVLTPEQIRAGEAAYYGSMRESILKKKVESAKAELPTLDRAGIEAKWKGNKYGFIAIAQKPNHGLKADALFGIWLKYWSDRYKSAEDLERAIVKSASEAGTYVRKINEYEDGDLNALGPDYDKARREIALGNLMFRHSVHAMELCRAADGHGRSLTLDEITQMVIDWAKIWDPMVGALEMYLTFGRGGGPRRIKTEPVKTEPIKTKTKPTIAEPAPKSIPRPKPFDMKQIGAAAEAPQILDAANFSEVKLKPGQDALYVLRDGEGNILKVGKTSASGAKGRFAVYKRAGKLVNTELQLEVYPLEPSARTAESYESALRSKVESEGHSMPWDNTGGRLGRPGFGTPGEGLRTPPITKGEMKELLTIHKGDLREVGEELGVHRRTADLWAKALGLQPGDFK